MMRTKIQMMQMKLELFCVSRKVSGFLFVTICFLSFYTNAQVFVANNTPFTVVSETFISDSLVKTSQKPAKIFTTQNATISNEESVSNAEIINIRVNADKKEESLFPKFQEKIANISKKETNKKSQSSHKTIKISTLPENRQWCSFFPEQYFAIVSSHFSAKHLFSELDLRVVSPVHNYRLFIKFYDYRLFFCTSILSTISIRPPPIFPLYINYVLHMTK